MDLSEKNSVFLNKAFKQFYDYRRRDDEKRAEEGKEPRAYGRVIRSDRKHGNKKEEKQNGVHNVTNEYTDREIDYNTPD